MQERRSSSSSSSSSSNSNNNNKSVRFAGKAKMRLALHIKEYNEEERQATFYTSVDYIKFKQEAKFTAHLLDNEQPISDNMGFCVRGIETMTREGKSSQLLRRRTALFSVLSEQERLHYEEASVCPVTLAADEQIAAVYADVVHENVASAHRTGLLDESSVYPQRSASSNKQKKRGLQTKKSVLSSYKQQQPSLFATKMSKQNPHSAIRRIVGAATIRI